MRANPSAKLTEVAGEHIIVPTGDSVYQLQGLASLNETGLFLWEKLANETTEEELVRALTEEYEVEEDACRAHVRAFLDKLRAVGLIIE